MQKSRKEKLNYSLFNLKKTEILAYLCHSRSFNCQTWDYNRRIKKNQAFLEKKLIKFKIILSYTKNICVNKRFFSSFALDIFGIMRYNIIKSVNCND